MNTTTRPAAYEITCPDGSIATVNDKRAFSHALVAFVGRETKHSEAGWLVVQMTNNPAAALAKLPNGVHSEHVLDENGAVCFPARYKNCSVTVVAVGR